VPRIPIFNPYRILGLMRSSSPQDVKRAYRELAKQLHPDRTNDPEALARFQQVAEAYQMLSDPQRRAAWDAEHGEEMNGEGSGKGNASGGGKNGSPPNGGAEDARPSRAGAGTTRAKAAASGAAGAVSGAAKKIGPGIVEGVSRVVGGTVAEINRRWSLGQDLRFTVKVPFAEACLGGEQQVTVEAPVRCAACDGRGTPKGATAECEQCGGQGVVAAERRFHLAIPAGTVSGQLTRIPGGGVPGARGGPEGDLTFVVEVIPHPLLERDGDDLRCRVPVPITTALIGGSAPVPTLEGSTAVEIPAGIENGQVLRLSGRGVRRGPARGDLLITVEVELPRTVTAEVRRLLLEAERQDPEGVFPRSTRYRRQFEGRRDGGGESREADPRAGENGDG
jgi:molecular chaperone DnaJ